MPDLLETYLSELARIRSSGAATNETSFYPTLSNLLNDVGKQLKPRITCVMPIANQGAGLPDGALFTQDQLQNRGELELIKGQLPSAGVIEVKGTGDDAWITANGAQVSKYWGKYNQVLVTNYRDFLLIGRDIEGKPIKLESFRLGEDERAFWMLTAHARKTAQVLGDRFVSYLKRVMLHSAPLTDPKEIAWFLASYAREAKARIEGKQLAILDWVRNALEESLGIKFEGKEGDHFFRSTLVQTLFYGIFSSWVLWSKQHTLQSSARFDWKSAAWSLNIPMVRELFEQIVTPSKLGALGIDNVLDWTELALNRVDRKEFFSTFEERHAVQYFYEPFLEAFDPDLRKQLGVWYTPPEIVQYMVARIDTVLREELEIADGLADKRVLILDPACGTGSYIVEVLHNIAQTLKKKGNDALLGHDLKMAAMERIFGFEILPAPFVVAHLQIGLFLQSAGTQLSEAKNERVSVYLTNSLTGWVHPSEPQKRLSFPELEKERDAADNVKRQKRILVILGNPPYNAFAGVSPREEQNLVEPYKEGLVTKWTIKKFNLDDLYIRFFRLAERRIVEQTGEGIICYVSNFSFLGGPSYVVMRKRFLDEFDKMWFDSMNGDSRETGKRTPDGKPDPSAFSTEKNPEGIRVGTVISLLVRKSKRQRKPTINYRDLWGVNKRENLLKSISEKPFNNMYRIVDPKEQDLYSFRASNIPRRYLSWPTLVELSKQQPFNGPVERRGGSLIKMKADKNKLDLVRDYLDPQKSSAEIKLIAPRFMTSSGEFKAEEARQYLVKTGVKYDHNKIVLFPFKPFDVRLAYLDANIQPLFSRPSPQLLRMREISGNAFLIARDTADKIPEGCPLYFSPLVCDYTFISGNTRHFPIWIYPEQQQKKSTKTSNIQSFQLTLAGEMEKVSPIANLSDASRKYLESLGLADPNTDSDTAETIWLHSLAIGYSPLYLRENSDGIRRGWPRIPLPDSKELLFDSAKLGKQIASLLDIRGTCAPRVTSILQDLKYIAVISRKGSVSLDPQAGDLKLTVGWGHGTELVMPGQGKSIERNYTDEEQVWISRDLKIKSTDIFRTLGETTYDIFLNDNTYWKNVPIRVWNYLIGGHQVLKKWLSYREFDVLNRSINPDEAREFSDIARRISGILLLEPALDENYYTVIRNIYKWTRIEDAI